MKARLRADLDDLARLSKDVPGEAYKAIVTVMDKRDADALKAVKCAGTKCDVIKKAASIVIKQRLLEKPLTAATKLSATEWKRRHATWLEGRIDDLDKKLGLRDEGKLRKQREEIETQLATTIGASNELARARVRQALLQRKPEDIARNLSKASNVASMSEYEIAGKELTAVQTVIAAKRQALKPSGRTATAESR